MHCPRCGEVNQESSNFCKRCGYSLKPLVNTEEIKKGKKGKGKSGKTKQEKKKTGKKKAGNKGLIVGIVILFLGIGIGAGALWYNGGIGKTVTDENVQKAIEASNLLTGHGIGLTPDGTVLAAGDSANDWTFSNYLRYYQNLDIKRLGMVAGQCFALTKDGALFYKDIKIQDEVESMEFCMHNVNIQGELLGKGGSLKYLRPKKGEEGYYDQIVGKKEETVEDYNEMIEEAKEEGYDDIYPSKLHGKFSYITSENGDYLLLDEDGCMILTGFASEECMDLDYSDWTDIATADFALHWENEDESVPTIAGIKKDGTLYAAGAYAEEILKWEKLSYISMSDGLIAGLTPEGRIKLTGMYADLVRAGCDVETWENIIAVHVLGQELNAMDGDGTMYCVEFLPNGYVSTQVLSEEKPDAEKNCYMIKNGKAYAGNNGVWEEVKE